MKNGDVVHVTRYGYSTDCDVWVVVDDDEMSEIIRDANVILGGHTLYNHTRIVLDSTDISEVVPPDKWPDKVCVAVAKYTMGVSDVD